MPAIDWPPKLEIVKHPTTGALWIKGDGKLDTSVWTGPYEDTKAGRAELKDHRAGLLRHYADNREWYMENW